MKTIYASWLWSTSLVTNRARRKEVEAIEKKGKLSFSVWRKKYAYMLRALYTTYLNDQQFTIEDAKNGRIMSYETFQKKMYKSLFDNSLEFKPMVNIEVVRGNDEVYRHIYE